MPREEGPKGRNEKRRTTYRAGYGRHGEYRRRDGVTTAVIRGEFKREGWLDELSAETETDLTKKMKSRLLADVEGDD